MVLAWLLEVSDNGANTITRKMDTGFFSSVGSNKRTDEILVTDIDGINGTPRTGVGMIMIFWSK